MFELGHKDEVENDLENITLEECLPTQKDFDYARELLLIAENLPEAFTQDRSLFITNLKEIINSVSDAMILGETLMKGKNEQERKDFLIELMYNSALIPEYIEAIEPLLLPQIFEIQSETMQALNELNLTLEL